MKKYLSKICKKKGIKLFMLSNTDSAHMKFINDNFSYLDVIKKRVLSYKVNMLKPDKRIFNYLLNEYKIKSQETLFIDDIKDNVIAAESVGINSIQYTTHEGFLKQINEFVKI
jgi:putative hydrolase of the HAD superfamily